MVRAWVLMMASKVPTRTLFQDSLLLCVSVLVMALIGKLGIRYSLDSLYP